MTDTITIPKAEYEQLARDLDRLWHGLNESVKLQAHYAELLNNYDLRERKVFKDSAEWLERLDRLVIDKAKGKET